MTFTIGIFELSLFVILIVISYYVGRSEGWNIGIVALLKRLNEKGFIKYREDINGEPELVPHPEK